MPSKTIYDAVKKIGLNDYEAKAFTSLLEFESLSAVDISVKSGIPRPRVYDILESLASKGLVISMPSRPVKFKALDLSTGFENLTKSRTEQFTNSINELKQLNSELSKIVKTKTSLNESNSENVWLLNGRKAIYSRLDDLLHNAEKEVIISSSQEGLERKTKAFKKHFSTAQKKGVSIKLISNKMPILDNDLLDSKIKISHNNKIHRLALIDNKQSLIFLNNNSDHENDTAILIESPELTSFLKQKLI